MKIIARTSLLILIILSMISLDACGPKDVEVHMFSSLSECEALVPREASNTEFVVYDSPAKDKNIEDLAYNDFYGCSVSTNDLVFELFAYEFPDKETAKMYFKNTTGQTATKTIFYSHSAGLTEFNRVVISGHLAYSVYGKTADEDTIIAYINRIFSQKIIEVEW